MIFRSRPGSMLFFSGLLFLFAPAAPQFVPSLFGAELLPFPSQERAPRIQQVAPRYRRPQPQPEIEQFRRDIAGFPCPELNALYSRIRAQYDTARTPADQEYYSRFLNELYREMSGRCN